MLTRVLGTVLSRRAATTGLVLAIAAAFTAAIGSHWHKLVGALLTMDPRWMAVALGLCLIYRVVNAHGWTLVLRTLGQPMRAGVGLRIWLTSEACRWLPGSVWSYGSRGVLAARAGVPAVVAAASLAWELVLTVLAWFLGAALGLALWEGDLPPAVAATVRAPAGWSVPAVLAAAGAVAGAGAVVSRAVGRRLARARLDLGRARTQRRELFGVLGFYVGMVVLNALTFSAVVRSVPGGERCPFAVVLAANSISWLAGLFALFAPGGLVVREASLSVLLSGRLTPTQAVSVALAWRAIQIATELIGYLVIALRGLVGARPASAPSGVLAEGNEV